MQLPTMRTGQEQDGPKEDIQHVETGMNLKATHLTDKDIKHGDAALQFIGEARVDVSPEDNKRILRKTDAHILTILVWVYFLQIWDKTIFGNGKVLGMLEANHLTGNDYSVIATMNAIAQLAWQPVSSYLLVRIPSRHLLTFMVFGWGTAQTCMSASKSFSGLCASRFFLGLFEAGCLPLSSLLTSQWYRRSEQPIRVAAWNGTNGMGTIMAAIVAFGFSHVHHGALQPWQLIFLLSGLITLITVPFIYYLIDSNVTTARFLSPEDRIKGIERLRANQTGTGSNDYKWRQALELAYDPKTYLYLGITIAVNVGASVTVFFGPTLIKNFGFSVQVSSLLNMPFGALQIIIVLGGCWAAQKAKNKSIPCALLILPVIIGLGLLYKQGAQGYFNQASALAGYYLLSFLYGVNPILVSWMMANTAGQTKKALIMSIFMCGAAVGNIVGPLMFDEKDKPFYLPGVRATLGLFCAGLGLTGVLVVVLYLLNKQRARQRVAKGKPAQIRDTSMQASYQQYGLDDEALGQNALLDLTDFHNEEFVYVY